MMKVAEEAIVDDPHLEKVTIMNHAPRFDTKDVDPVQLKTKLATFANSYFLELWLDSSMKDKIIIGSHTLESSADVKKQRYTDERTNKYDGVHLYGRAGKEAYTESVLNIMISSLQSQPSQTSQQNSNDYHTDCPQTKFGNAQRRKYSTVVAGKKTTIKTQNRFSPLSQQSGN